MTTFQPTHEITFKPSAGEARVTLVALVDGAAYSREEWEGETAADWERTEDGRWLFQGQVTPGGAAGEVTVRKIATPDPAEWLVEGAGPDDVWPADDAEDAAGQAARAQWGDSASVEWVGTGPAPAVAEFRATWLEAGVEMSKRIVVSRVAS